MPEMLMLVCSPSYRNHSAENGRDTLINLSEAERDWHSRFPGFQKKGEHSTNTLTFSDYAIVIQAALLGSGIALGWLNVVSHWMLDGALIPVVQEVSLTGRTCQLIRPTHKPLRPVVSEIRDWIIAEAQADLSTIGKMYPALMLETY